MRYVTNSLIKRGHSWSVRYIVPSVYQAKVFDVSAYGTT